MKSSSPLPAGATSARHVPPADAVQPVANETLDRTITGLLTVVPFLLLGLAGWQMWNWALGWSDIIVFGIIYSLTGLGVTVGFHRLFTHRAFKTSPAMRGVFAVLGSAAIEGPIISWVSDHRKHHACSDKHGDPHSPHHGHGHGWRAKVKGLFHAHVGWLFRHDQRALKERFAPDLIADPVVTYVDRTFFVWAIGGVVAAFGLGWAIGGSVMAGVTGMLWGGAVRIFLLHHVTYSINSLCHMFGRQPYETRDESRNLAWLAPLSFGEAWHNNHHAFPSSARHGLRWWQLDSAALVISALERLGLVWDVVRISPEQRSAKAVAA